MIGILVDIASIVIGGSMGLLLKKGISERISKAVMIGIGLCIAYIGITGLSAEGNTIAILLSLVIGAIIGTAIDIDARLNNLGEKIEKKLVKDGSDNSIAKGFVTMTLLSCTGAYAFMASINAGLGNNEMLFTKAVIDFFVSVMLGSTLGIGVILAAGIVFLYQGLLALFAQLLSSVLVGEMLAAFSCVGAILTIPLGTNMMGITDIKIANYIPAIIVAPILAWILTLIPGV